ncbi:MAG: proline dehydrogenase family protein [Deltaproteobacteria bacterium]|nr:proline dehydrogenase family protein [Deltaproteobacteria bacterium]
MRLLYPLAKRFIAGQRLEEALPHVSALAARGFRTTLDLLGESVSDRRMAAVALDGYLQLIETLHTCGLECNISVKLTQLGLDIDRELAGTHLMRLVNAVAGVHGFLRVDMEGSAYTQATLDLVVAAHRSYPGVGTVLQAMLYRSEADVETLCRERVPIRLVKGAYKEPPALAFQRKEEVDHHYVLLMERLFKMAEHPAIATHDERIVAHALRLVTELGVSRTAFEFQMLYGIARQRQDQLLHDGWPVRIYVPYGNAWFAYVVRRLRERKENLWFVAKHLFHK